MARKPATEKRVEWRCQWMKQHVEGRRPIPCDSCYSLLVVSMRVPFDPDSVASVGQVG